MRSNLHFPCSRALRRSWERPRAALSHRPGAHDWSCCPRAGDRAISPHSPRRQRPRRSAPRHRRRRRGRRQGRRLYLLMVSERASAKQRRAVYGQLGELRMVELCRNRAKCEYFSELHFLPCEMYTHGFVDLLELSLGFMISQALDGSMQYYSNAKCSFGPGLDKLFWAFNLQAFVSMLAYFLSA